MPQLGWYLKRARVMGREELLYRARQAAGLVSLYKQHTLGVGIAGPAASAERFSFCRLELPQLPSVPFDISPLKRDAEELLQGRIQMAGRTWEWSKFPDT